MTIEHLNAEYVYSVAISAFCAIKNRRPFSKDDALAALDVVWSAELAKDAACDARARASNDLKRALADAIPAAT